jgi:predicted nicotinamide N-methyase
VWSGQFKIRDYYWAPARSLGSGFRAWEASVLFARWVLQRKALFSQKRVLEVGAGASGLPGLAASLCAEAVTITEKVPQLLDNIR